MKPATVAPLLDSAIIVIFLCFAWLTVLYVLVQALPLVTGRGIALSIIAAAVVACLFSSAALIALLFHIWKNRADLYR